MTVFDPSHVGNQGKAGFQGLTPSEAAEQDSTSLNPHTDVWLYSQEPTGSAIGTWGKRVKTLNFHSLNQF